MKVEVVEISKPILAENSEIKFAYVFGSFIADENFNDIDIGVFIQPLRQEDIFKITADLKERISKALIKKGGDIKPDRIDIVVLNCVSFTFLHRIFKSGKLILDRIPELRTSIIGKNADTYRECVGFRAEVQIL